MFFSPHLFSIFKTDVIPPKQIVKADSDKKEKKDKESKEKEKDKDKDKDKDNKDKDIGKIDEMLTA